MPRGKFLLRMAMERGEAARRYWLRDRWEVVQQNRSKGWRGRAGRGRKSHDGRGMGRGLDLGWAEEIGAFRDEGGQICIGRSHDEGPVQIGHVGAIEGTRGLI